MLRVTSVARRVTACVLLSSAAFGQDTIEPGFGIKNLGDVPLFSVQRTLSNEHYFQFDGNTFSLHRPNGVLLLNYGSTAAFEFPSFAQLAPDESFVIVGESSNGNIYRVDLAPGSSVTPLSNLMFNYDAAFDSDPDYIIVSAALGGFGAGNDLVRVNVLSGATQVFAHLDGPSGPVQVDANGTVYYGTQNPNFPPPPGSSDIITWSSAQVTAGLLLDASDANSFITGLDSTRALAFSPVTEHLFVSGAFNSAESIFEFDEGGAYVRPIYTTQVGNFFNGIEFVAGRTEATFQAYQPQNVQMRLRATDFSLVSDYVTLAPARTTAEISGPTSGQANKTIAFDGAPHGGTLLVLMGDRSLQLAQEEVYHFASWLAPFHSALHVADWMRRFSIPVDQNGEALFQYVDPGNLHGTLVFQAVLLDSLNRPVGTSEIALN